MPRIVATRAQSLLTPRLGKDDAPVRQMSLPSEFVLRQRVTVTETAGGPVIEHGSNDEGFLTGPGVVRQRTNLSNRTISQPRDPLSVVPSMTTSRIPCNTTYTRSSKVSDETGTDETGTDETGTDETGTDETGTDETGTDETGTADCFCGGADESVNIRHVCSWP